MFDGLKNKSVPVSVPVSAPVPVSPGGIFKNKQRDLNYESRLEVNNKKL
ncbi:MAG: hypothetical protein BMS9Abin31_0852 [Gammaproteobacteria bacterium]|nr:MAG: hypothetical protein BMS9Abin31_0852 [Gammaproteobacteria bacterium]